jgi:NADH-quinone oxidoreductase subunit F
MTSCWVTPAGPAPELLADLKSGALADAFAAGPKALEKLIGALRREHLTKPVVYVGAGTCGLGAGAGKTLAAVRAWLAREKRDVEVVEVGCAGFCYEEPTADVQLPGRPRVCFGQVAAESVPAFLADALAGRIPPNVLGQFRGAEPCPGVPYLDEHPFLARQRRVVLAGSGIVDPLNLDEYIARGGYSAIARALKKMTPGAICDLVEASGLRGRGGAGFPTGKKWKFARAVTAEQKYLICNGDEGDPGAFMDRAVCESEPHRLLEGMIIAAYAIGATKAIIYIRAEYPLAVKRLIAAIAQAKTAGLLGENILDSGNELEISIKMGAGAFVCGEETALIHSVEGRRGMPRPRPPFPAVKGLFGRPTVINNVETLANLPMILERGADWFAAMGTGGSRGTKVFALSGAVERTGLVEVPMGTTLRGVVLDIGGGIPHGRRCKAVQIGGPSGGCVPESQMDIPTDYEALKAFGTIMGSGGLVVLDETTCMVDFAKFFMEFVQSESCGKCIPCREGTRRMLEILESLTRSRRKEADRDALLRMQGIMHLKELAETIKDTSLCGLGQTAPNPVLSTLKWFRDEYEAHVFDRRCPAGACKELTGAPCQTACPVGTEVWRYVAHVGRGEYTDAYRVIRDANPFPSVCARVCHHPCEAACRAGATGGEAIAARTLKRFVVDRVAPESYVPQVKPASPAAARVAVIGAGPSGLTAAHCLGAMGFKVTLFEREAKPGGMLVGAIPEYRLPRRVLESEIAALLNGNVELKLNHALGRDFALDSLQKDGYRAVYLATGAHESRALGVPGEENVAGVIAAIRFLKAHNLYGQSLAAGRVGVIGGGNCAVDAARVALRQKGVQSVAIFYRRTRQEMPAYAEEIEAALQEGVVLEQLIAPVEVLSADGKLTGVRFIRNELGPRDESGRQRPVPAPGSERVVPLDTLVVAISEQPESSVLQGVRRTRRGTVQISPESYLTDLPGVFAGGDATTGPQTVIGAIAAGKNAALMIRNYVSGKLLKALPKVKLPTAYVEPAGLPTDEDAADQVPRVRQPERPVAARRGNFEEVELCISETDARCEARRCLRCDLEFTEPAGLGA